MRKPIRKDILR
jgi:hypothetical protein